MTRYVLLSLILCSPLLAEWSLAPVSLHGKIQRLRVSSLHQESPLDPFSEGARIALEILQSGGSGIRTLRYLDVPVYSPNGDELRIDKRVQIDLGEGYSMTLAPLPEIRRPNDSIAATRKVAEAVMTTVGNYMAANASEFPGWQGGHELPRWRKCGYSALDSR